MTETNQLLRDYVCNGSETAFRELVGRYMNLVYSVAVRRVGGDAHLAQDVVQTVFTDLAGKARLLPSNVTLGGWLHRHTCFVSSSLLRAERRWQTREREAVEMNSLQNSPETVWMKLAPMLDEAIDQLGAPTTDLQLTTRVDDFADTRLQWRMDRGEQVPTNYTLRLTRPVPIGGKVVDADGQPVAGAKVGWNHETDAGAMDAETRPQSHAFAWIEVTTDAEGRWRINRIAPEMIRLLYGSAKHSEHVDSGLIFTARNPEAEKQLLAETHVFQLGRAISIRGIVLDAEGQPVEGASVLLGQRGMSDRRETQSTGDGTFNLLGCKPGKNLLSAEAKGFAATTMEVDVTVDSEPFRLTLQRGRILRLQVVNQADQPVAKAYVWLNTFDRRSNSGRAASPAPIQADFSPRTDADGKVVWSNAPAAEMSFDVQARGWRHQQPGVCAEV